ncbi:MAG: insulinase family protein, partial [Desulfobulbaceae bacterium]|nr:insulinase family protein [Desulfobulbaceae bacterium]
MMSKRILRRGFLHFSVLLAVTVLVAGCTCPFKRLFAPDDGICISNEWSHPGSDLAPDKDIHYGRLANGMGYVVMENREPLNRVAMHLYIKSGSLNEEDDQRGLGHFVEHMLFNGTTNFPPGTLVKRFQTMGMTFGADSNGYTTFDSTVYNIMLAGNDEPTLREGLTIMADYARGGLFLEDEVNRERGVILAEKRTRDTAQYRVFEKTYKFSFEGTAAADRMVIGTDEVLTSVDSTRLKRFYDQWYRPENMVLVVVGDVSFAGMEPLIKERLNSLQGEGPSPACRDFGAIVKKGEQFFYLHEPELGHSDISFESLWDISARRDSGARREADLPGEVAVSLMNNRLKRLVRESDRLLSEAALYRGEMFGQIGYVSLNAQTEGEKWQQALERVHEALRQAQEQGFHQSELERVKKEMIGDLERKDQTASSRDSRELAGAIIEAINEREVMLSPRQELEFYRPRVERLSLSEVNEAFRQMWNHGNTLVEVVGTATIAGDSQRPEDVLRTVYNNSAKVVPGPYHESAKIKFPYLSPQKKEAVIAESRELSGIGARSCTFKDGTVLNLKKTDFRENEVLLEVRFGNGMLGEPSIGLARLSEGVVNESGLGSLTREELNEALAGSNVELRFRVEENSFVLRGKALSNELPLLLQLVHAQFNDPGFRPEAYRLSEERYRQEYDMAIQSVEGMFHLQGRAFLAGGNSRYSMATDAQMAALTLKDVENWLRPIFAGAVPEIS